MLDPSLAGPKPQRSAGGEQKTIDPLFIFLSTKTTSRSVPKPVVRSQSTLTILPQ